MERTIFEKTRRFGVDRLGRIEMSRSGLAYNRLSTRSAGDQTLVANPSSTRQWLIGKLLVSRDYVRGAVICSQRAGRCDG